MRKEFIFVKNTHQFFFIFFNTGLCDKKKKRTQIRGGRGGLSNRRGKGISKQPFFATFFREDKNLELNYLLFFFFFLDRERIVVHIIQKKNGEMESVKRADLYELAGRNKLGGGFFFP